MPVHRNASSHAVDRKGNRAYDFTHWPDDAEFKKDEMEMKILAVAFVVIATLTACGSTGSSPSSTIVQVDQTKMPTAEAVLPSFNDIRKENGRQQVIRSAAADRAAQIHAEDMARNNFFSHRGSDGTDGPQRISRAGCGGFRAENIAEGTFNEKSVLQAWMNSPSHRASMLKPKVRYYGLANVDRYWVMTLSSRC